MSPIRAERLAVHALHRIRGTRALLLLYDVNYNLSEF